jgi:hypothetical protein
MPIEAELKNAGVGSNPAAAASNRGPLASGGNPDDNPLEFLIAHGVERPVLYHIFLYTTNKTEFILNRPPFAKNLKVHGVGTPYTGKTKFWTGDDKCRLFAVLPDVVVTLSPNVFTGATDKLEEDGRRVAMDILCTANRTIDQDLVIDPAIMSLNGTNYLGKGMFFSLNNPPKPEEISKAVGRMETYYRFLLQEAHKAEIQGPKALQTFLANNPEAYAAALHFGQKVSWNTIVEAPETCDLTGETYKKGAAWHTDPSGFVCVHDWKRAVEAGRKTKADVPEDKRWWKEPAAPTK